MKNKNLIVGCSAILLFFIILGLMCNTNSSNTINDDTKNKIVKLVNDRVNYEISMEKSSNEYYQYSLSSVNINEVGYLEIDLITLSTPYSINYLVEDASNWC